ncbi:hypothetical protein ElyMa_003318000 [Elysia marginata]|uniref:Uncharacterized protein n=1 Tax=Elysia marginata TaxID=1093978 RepID=A0AAV4JF15_9GAST|nr:hypothetical protein ElyMa_003318000 [Elysia marginata]
MIHGHIKPEHTQGCTEAPSAREQGPRGGGEDCPCGILYDRGKKANERGLNPLDTCAYLHRSGSGSTNSPLLYPASHPTAILISIPLRAARVARNICLLANQRGERACRYNGAGV